MASTYGGYTFYMRAEQEDNTLKRPLLVPEDFGIVRNRLPFLDMEQIQFTGKGNLRMKVKCEVYSDGDFAAILAMACDNTPRTLVTEWGESMPNMLLMDVTDVWRVTFQEEIHFTATFEKLPAA